MDKPKAPGSGIRFTSLAGEGGQGFNEVNMTVFQVWTVPVSTAIEPRLMFEVYGDRELANLLFNQAVIHNHFALMFREIQIP